MRAIDADAFKDYIRGACEDMKHLFNDGGAVAKLITESFCKDIDEQPTIQPRRGKWIKLDMHRGMADHKCTACGQECYVPTCMGEPMYAFCPNCGAKMEVTE